MHQTPTKDEFRHNQLFELLRQTHQAQTTVWHGNTPKSPKRRKMSEAEMQVLQAAAVRSLQASP